MPEKVFIRSIPDEIWRALKARASLEGLTVSEAVQEALRRYLTGTIGPVESDVWAGITDIGGSGSPDGAEAHDRHVAAALAGDRDE